MIKKTCYEFTNAELMLIAECIGSKTLAELTADKLKLAKGITRRIAYIRFGSRVEGIHGSWKYVPHGRLVFIKE